VEGVVPVAQLARLAHADFLLHNTLSLYTLSLHAFSVHAFSKHALSLYTLHGGIDRHIFSLESERCTQKDAAAAGWRVAGGSCFSVMEWIRTKRRWRREVEERGRGRRRFCTKKNNNLAQW
jgi:hypothetical protein